MDYAKFDHIAAELSDDEDARPTVTRLAAPSRVTIGPTGASVGQPQQPPSLEPPEGYQWEPRPDPPFGPVRRAARPSDASAGALTTHPRRAPAAAQGGQ